jgi:CubicO group peptidase (beta-lactamase class C family)
MLPLAIVPLLVSIPAQDPRADLEAFVQRVMTQALEHEGVPGLSVAVMQDGELVLARAFGTADERLGLPMKPETVFPIGSLGRSFVTAAALREVERGARKLDAPLGGLLADLPAALQPITLRQLLEGSSGLPASTALFARLVERESSERLTRQEFLALLAALPAQSAPGEGFAADSTSWLLVPLLIEELGKRSFADCVTQELSTPLGLRDTGVRDEVAGTLGHAADCREVLAGSTLDVWSGFEPRAAHAQLFSTASELVRWQTALFKHELLSEASTRILKESVRSRTGEVLGLNACFTLGELGGQPSWRHVGGIAGWRGALGWYERGNLAVCVLANCADARVGPLEEDIARFVLRLPPREVQDLPLEPAEIQAFCGGYQLGTLRVRIFERDAHLWYESAAEQTFRLRSQGFRRFLSENGEVALRFSSEKGRAETFDETRKGSTSVARRMD